MASRKLKIFFYMIDAVGPQNACVGLGQVLLSRGHDVYFLTKTDNRLNGKFSSYGFKVCPLKLDGQRELSNEEAIEEQKKETEQMSQMFAIEKIDPVEKLKAMFSNPLVLDMFVASLEEYEPLIRQWINKIQPDLLVVDSIGITPPSLINSPIPWVYIYCSNPLGIFHHPKLPPGLFGLPIDSSPETILKYRQIFDEHHDGNMAPLQRRLNEKFGYPTAENAKPYIVSPYLNLYQFPEELDYHDVTPIPEEYLRVDAFVRTELGEPFIIPTELSSQMKPGDRLIYFSLGSIGTSKVELVKQIVAVLAKTPHFYLVSKGIFHEQIDLPGNMWGDRYVPQTKILPLVDLAIIHGGNNSLTEAIHFGTPVIVMPLFYDQLDNAQRVAEKGFGIKVDPFDFTDDELLQAIEKVLNDKQLKEKYIQASKRIQASQSKLKAVLAMEKVVEDYVKK